jgi:DUF1365 family protein
MARARAISADAMARGGSDVARDGAHQNARTDAPAGRSQAERPASGRAHQSGSSAIYVGQVRHRRFAPVARSFTFPLYMLMIDLDELPTLFEGSRLWSATRPAIGRFRRGDYLGDPSVPLATAVRERVAGELGFVPEGPIRLLTHARQFGYVFNPVSFYYCYGGDGGTLQAIVAEITNTPWKERHAYVIDCRGGAAGHEGLEAGSGAASGGGSGSPVARRVTRSVFSKRFHVSPFMPMDLSYDWSFTSPPEMRGGGETDGDDRRAGAGAAAQRANRLAIHMALRETGEGEGVAGHARPGVASRIVFDATLRLGREELTAKALDRMLLRFPFMTARVVLSIHMHALKLWLRRVPVFAHPARRVLG